MDKNIEKIGIDLTLISSDEIKSGNLTGSIAIFTESILEGFVKNNTSDNFVLIINSAAKKLVLKKFPGFDICEVGGALSLLSYIFFGKQLNGFIRRNGIYNRKLKETGIKYVWFPYMLPEFTFNIDVDYVGTCHDLMKIGTSTEEYKCMFTNSKQIIAISNYVKNQIVESFSVEEQSVAVIPNAINIDTNTKTEAIVELYNKSFILDINAYKPRKNTITMIKAYYSIMDKIDYDLVLCGGYKDDDYYDECKKLIDTLQIGNKVHTYLAVSEEEKNWLLNNCSLFVMPSENEGFGRTPIEAALCMKPVISTRVTSLEESTCGLLNYYENPRDEKELADMMLKVLLNKKSEENLQNIKDIYISKYSVEKISNQYIKVFEEAFQIEG